MPHKGRTAGAALNLSASAALRLLQSGTGVGEKIPEPLPLATDGCGPWLGLRRRSWPWHRRPVAPPATLPVVASASAAAICQSFPLTAPRGRLWFNPCGDERGFLFDAIYAP